MICSTHALFGGKVVSVWVMNISGKVIDDKGGLDGTLCRGLRILEMILDYNVGVVVSEDPT